MPRAPFARLLAPTAPWILLIVTLLFATAYKIRAFESSPRFDARDESCLFWTESAFHYRYARMVAERGFIPAFDRDVQWPEGARPYREFTILMEYPPGILYKILQPVLPGVPFHRWLVWFICVFSSLSIVAAYWAGRVVWGSGLAGAVAAAAYGLSPLSFNRLVGNYGKEDFALPLLFLSFAAFLSAISGGERRRARAFQAGILLALGLAAWHVSRFYATFFFAAAGPILLLLEPERERVARVLRAVVVVLLVAGLLHPGLREKGFLLSSGFLFGAALLAAVEAARRFRLAPARALLLFAGLAAAALAVEGKLSPASREYSHVTGLAIEKIRHLGQKPADPSRLSYDARCLWVEAFESPSLSGFLVTISTLLPWGAAALAIGVRRAARRRLTAPQALAVASALLFLVSYLFLERFSPFFVFFLALAVPIVLDTARARAAILALLLLSFGYEIWYDLHFDRKNPWRSWVIAAFPVKAPDVVPNFGNNVRVVRWIRAHLDDRAVLLTWNPTGPMVLAYTGRPIVLHSKFESSGLRDKERRMIEALYGDEEAFYALARGFGADFFLYQANLLLDGSDASSRYMADRLRVPATSAAYLFHYHPERLRRFVPVYQDSYYRLYRVMGEDEVVVPPNPLPYEEIFDPRIAAPEGDDFDQAMGARSVRALVERVGAIQKGAALARAGGPSRDEAALVFREVLRRSPDNEDALAQLALLAAGDGRLEEARFLLSRALTTHPDYPELHTVRGILLRREGRGEEAAAAFRRALEVAPGYEPARRELKALGRRAGAP